MSAGSTNFKGETIESRLLVDLSWQYARVMQDPVHAPVAGVPDGLCMFRAVGEDESRHLMERVHAFMIHRLGTFVNCYWPAD